MREFEMLLGPYKRKMAASVSELLTAPKQKYFDQSFKSS